MTTELKLPTVLAFESKLVCSDALMLAGNWEDINVSANWKPIKIQEKSVRGTISNRDERSDITSNDYAKFLKDIANPNPQTVDNAALPFDCDTLKVKFSLRVIGNLAKPSACNRPNYQEKLASLINNYALDKELGFYELAKRYAKNIANSRFLWRNRLCADAIQIEVIINNLTNEKLIFNAYEIGLKDFNDPENAEVKAKLDKLATAIQVGLADNTGQKFTFIDVEAFVKLGNGQQVYPSQEMVMEKADKGGKSKYLYQVHDGNTENSIAAMHSQKIGNAIRTIDDWHSQADKVGAIAIEPYGSVTIAGDAYRPKSDGSFYKLLDDWVLNDIEPTKDDKHYIMAVLIRGGVFSGQASEDDEKKEKAKAKKSKG